MFKKLSKLIVITLLFTGEALAQSPGYQGLQSYKFSTATANPTSVRNIGSGIAYHELIWTVSGTVSACAVQVDSSADGVTWNSADVIASQDCSANGQAAAVNDVVNYIRIHPTSFTGTGNVTAVWVGYINDPSGGAGCTSTDKQLLFSNGIDNCTGVPSSSVDPVTGDVTLGAGFNVNSIDGVSITDGSSAGIFLAESGASGIYLLFTGGAEGDGVVVVSNGRISFDDSAFSGGGSALNLDATTPGVITASTILNAITGFQQNSAAPSGHYLRGNGTEYVDDTIQAGDLPAVPFSDLSSATNTSAAMLVGTGASLGPTGTGAITATAPYGPTFSLSGLDYPTVTITHGGTPETTAYNYIVVGTDNLGGTRRISQSTATGPTLGNLGNTNYNIITVGAWSSSSPLIAPAGACNVYRTVGGAAQGLIGTIASCAAGGVLNDKALVASAGTAPVDSSGLMNAESYSLGGIPVLFYPFGDTSSLCIGPFTCTAQQSRPSGGTGSYNIAIGLNALYLTTTGVNNTALGDSALGLNLTGSHNTALGSAALASSVDGNNNVAIGWGSMSYGTSGNGNTAVGFQTIGAINTGSANSAFGNNALFANTSGAGNVAMGYNALTANTTAAENTAIGDVALAANVGGASNTAVGSATLNKNVSSNNNTAVGYAALNAATAGNNTGVGYQSLLANTSGTGNTQVGYSSGGGTNATGTNITLLGINADVLADGYTNAFALGNAAIVGASNTGVIGNSSVTDVYFGSTSAAAKEHSAGLITSGKCAANSSSGTAACGAASSGSFSCDTGTSAGTCVINTTAVAAGSTIWVQPDASLGSLLSVTCNTTADTGLVAPRVAARSAATSFTINMGTFASHPMCFSYGIN